MSPEQTHNGDDNDPRRLFGEPNDYLDRVEFSGKKLSIGIDGGNLPIYQTGFDWSVIVLDQRVQSYEDERAYGYIDGEEVARGRVVEVMNPEVRGLLVDVLGDPDIVYEDNNSDNR